MKKNYRNKRSLLVFAGSLAMTASPCLFAGSPALTGLVAEANNAESAFAAPAGMSRLKGTRMTVQTMFVHSFADFEVDANQTTVPGGNPSKGSGPTIIPSIYYVRQLNDRWHAGLSLTIPSGFGSNYGNTWSGRYETVDFSLVYVALTPAVSYRVNDKLSLGGAMGINYTSESSEVKIPQPFQDGDGKITSDLDGVGVSVTLSLLYEFTDQTRAGISWTSDSDADLEGNVRLRKLDPVFDEVATRLGIKNINTELTNTLPQRVLAGVYHEFDSGRYFTVDGMWMKFSDFSVSDIKLNGNDVNINTPDIYNDIYALTIGAGFPASDPRLTYKIGAMYVSQAVDNEDRTFSIRLDKMWGFGAGVAYDLASGNSVDLNATLINVGDASVDKESVRDFRVVGKNDDPWALMFELSYHM
jgi:long-chain fatty acid transport protein